MKSKGQFLFLIILFCILIYSLFTLTPVSHQINNVQVGICYCTWYKGQENDSSWNRSIIVDVPFLNYSRYCYYNSCDPMVCRSHIECFDDLGIDFAMMTWYGLGSFTDYADKVVFQTAMNYSKHVKFCILVQPYNETLNGYNYSQIYDYIYSAFVMQYPGMYYNYSGKPLILFYNAEHLTGIWIKHLQYDPRFTVIVYGSRYAADWLYENISPYYEGPSPRNRHVPVIPRFDETNFDNITRPKQYKIDQNLTDGLYDRTWQNAIDYVKKGYVDVITIQCWNEYAERSNIEPHKDATANVDDFYLYRKTKTYMQILRGVTVEPPMWYQDSVKLTLAIFVVVIIGVMFKQLRKGKMKLGMFTNVFYN